jgi:hypothetical protein
MHIFLGPKGPLENLINVMQLITLNFQLMNHSDSSKWLDINSFSSFSFSISQIIGVVCKIRKLKIKRP